MAFYNVTPNIVGLLFVLGKKIAIDIFFLREKLCSHCWTRSQKWSGVRPEQNAPGVWTHPALSKKSVIRVTFALGKMAKEKEAFEEGESAPKKPGRVPSLKLKEDGSGIDWESVQKGKRDAFIDTLSRDQSTLEMLGLVAKTEEAKKDALSFKPSHIKEFLDGYAMIEAFAIPKFLSLKSKGAIKISSSLAGRACTFTDEQKDSLAEPGAEWANNALPEWAKKFFLEIGPGAKFFGYLGLITMQHTKAMLTLWEETNGRMAQPIPTAPPVVESPRIEMVPEAPEVATASEPWAAAV